MYPGGIPGFSMKKPTCDRWVLNAKQRADSYRNLKKILSVENSSTYVHHDLNPRRIKKEEDNVQSVLYVFENTFSNPFTSTDLISLSTGKSATPVISNDLINAKTKGKEAMESFVNERLPANNDSCFFSLIKKLKLKTFDYFSSHQKCEITRS